MSPTGPQHIQPLAANPPIGRVMTRSLDAAAGGRNVLFSVVCAPGWASVASGHPKDPRCWQPSYRWPAGRAGSRPTIWNQETSRVKLAPSHQPGNFVELLRAAYLAINADASVLVVSGAPTQRCQRSQRRWTI